MFQVGISWIFKRNSLVCFNLGSIFLNYTWSDNNNMTPFCLYIQTTILELNVVGRVGVVGGSETKFSDHIRRKQTSLMCSYELELTPLNTSEEFPLIYAITLHIRVEESNSCEQFREVRRNSSELFGEFRRKSSKFFREFRRNSSELFREVRIKSFELFREVRRKSSELFGEFRINSFKLFREVRGNFSDFKFGFQNQVLTIFSSKKHDFSKYLTVERDAYEDLS
jgi:hypothetical protein